MIDDNESKPFDIHEFQRIIKAEWQKIPHNQIVIKNWKPPRSGSMYQLMKPVAYILQFVVHDEVNSFLPN